MSETTLTTTVPTDATAATEPTETAEPTESLEVDKLDFSDDSAIRATYGETNQSGKGKIRAHIRKMVDELARTEPNADTDLVSVFAEFKRLTDLLDSLKTVPNKSTKEVDYVETIAERAVSLRIAANHLVTGAVDGLPEGLELDFDEVYAKADELYERYYSDSEDEMDFRVGLAESAKPFQTIKFGGKAGKRDIAEHIRQWAETVESGTFATNQAIAKYRSTEYPEPYNGNNPSSGAIAAHLFPQDNDGKPTKYDKSDVTGVRPVAANATHARGARKM